MSVGERRLAGKAAHAEARQRADRRQRDIVANGRGEVQAARLAILGHQRHAEAAGVRRRIDRRPARRRWRSRRLANRARRRRSIRGSRCARIRAARRSRGSRLRRRSKLTPCEDAPPAAAAHRVEREIAHRKNGRALELATESRWVSVDVPPDHRRNDRASTKGPRSARSARAGRRAARSPDRRARRLRPCGARCR